MTTSKTETQFSIRAPLLAFERVHRRTGMIRKTCTFHNPADGHLELDVRHGFREHSWIQLVPEQQDRDTGKRLLLEPGDTRVHVLMNTDSSNFPYDRFRGRIYFQDNEATAVQWIEVSFEEIEELQDYERRVAVINFELEEDLIEEVEERIERELFSRKVD